MENIDWEKVLDKCEKDMLLADAISKQIKEERKNSPENYDSKSVMERVKKDLDKNHINAINVTDNGGKRG